MAGNGEDVGGELYVRVHTPSEPELSRNITARSDPEYAFVFPLGQSADESQTGAEAGETQDSQSEAAE